MILLTVGSGVLGILNCVAMVLAMRGRNRAAGITFGAMQVPYVFYDILTRQYGFLIIVPFAVLTMLYGWKSGVT